MNKKLSGGFLFFKKYKKYYVKNPNNNGYTRFKFYKDGSKTKIKTADKKKIDIFTNKNSNKINKIIYKKGFNKNTKRTLQAENEKFKSINNVIKAHNNNTGQLKKNYEISKKLKDKTYNKNDNNMKKIIKYDKHRKFMKRHFTGKTPLTTWFL